MAIEQHQFPCPTCGANMRFDPTTRKLSCAHCGHEEDTGDQAGSPWGKAVIREQDFAKAVKERLSDVDLEETQVLKCESCGAQVEYEPGEHAAECPFCASPVVSGTGVNRHIKPKGVAPFMLDEPSAKKAMTDWLGRLWFAPNGLSEYARKGRRMEGIYVPYWTYDAESRSAYVGQRGTIYYETRTVMRDGKPHQQAVQKIRWQNVRGRVARAFDDVLILASQSLPKKFTEALEPWDLSGLEPYTTQYIAGFRAEAYMVDLAEGYNTARVKMNAIIERDVRFDIGGDQQRIQNIETDISDVTFKHILLPIWVAAYKYRGKSYRFVVNGQTGKVQGERPWSAWKITFAVLLGLLIAAGIGYAIAVNEGDMMGTAPATIPYIELN